MSRPIEEIETQLELAEQEREQCYVALCIAQDALDDADSWLEALSEELDQAKKETANAAETTK